MANDGEARFQTLHEIIKAARGNLAQGPWDFLVGGSESETTLNRNRLALDRLAFRPRVLRNVADVNPGTTFLGRDIRLPVALAPIGSIEFFAPEGGAAAAQASQTFNIPQFLSSVCDPGLEAVAAAADNQRLFQLYVRGDDAFVDDHVQRAVDNGYAGFCITVDTQVPSRRERDLARRWTRRTRGQAATRDFQAAFGWDHVKRFKDQHSVPLALKGIATAEDAELACQHGVEMVYVSNHGGRQLDHGRGAIEMLPEVVRAVAGRAVVIIDGGFMRGTDVVKALALGADLVSIGRLECLGLAADGVAGLVRTLELLEDEIFSCMGLLGISSLAQLDASFVRAGEPVREPHVTSAFNLLDLDDEGY